MFVTQPTENDIVRHQKKTENDIVRHQINLSICCVFPFSFFFKKNLLGGLQLQMTILHQFDSFSVHLDHLIKLHEHDQGKKIQNGSESHAWARFSLQYTSHAKKFANLWVVVLSNIQCCGRSLVSD